MKKSNKLLLGGFLAVLLLVTAIHVTLYAKYKSGDYTVYNAEDELTPGSMQSFPHIIFVLVRNVPDAIIEFGDVARVDKSNGDGIQYVQKGDTLVITGNGGADKRRIGNVVFNLPHDATLSLSNSALSFKAGKDIGAHNLMLNLQKSQALFPDAGAPLRFGHVTVIASDNSTATFQGNTQVANLEVQLNHSTIEYAEGDIGQLSIETDSVSRISLQSKHLLKAQIKTSVHQ